MRIGFIGLGNMGAAMAANLIKAGHEVTVYNRSRPRSTRWPPRVRGRPTRSPMRAAAMSCSPCSPTTTPSQVSRSATTASWHRLAGAATHVSSSTISVALAERLTAAHAEAGQQFVAAPVFGRPEAAQAAKLFVVAAGEPATIEALSPAFDADRPAHIRRVGGAEGRQPGQAERQLPHHIGDRVTRRGDGAGRQGGRRQARSTSTS